MSSQATTLERPRLDDSLRQYSSQLDETRGPLRTTADGNLLNEDTGDWLLLDTPPHDDIDQDMNKARPKGPAISLPESKNGATGLDNPRARKPLMRLLRNKLSGSDRLPADCEDAEDLTRRKLRAEMDEARKKDENKVQMKILMEIQKHYGLQIGQYVGKDWFEHALIDAKYWKMVLDKASELGGE
ncbi:hypothetical protein DE146DRAFT_751076 [Phaeosphaeria sp. MPI-PUGE-AT-0046c]|nr:hypothetical protein DE146DRAFT_751076 [Phaeosphaeria sp. MPI-PUGE-AT-0046c]